MSWCTLVVAEPAAYTDPSPRPEESGGYLGVECWPLPRKGLRQASIDRLLCVGNPVRAAAVETTGRASELVNSLERPSDARFDSGVESNPPPGVQEESPS